MISLYASGLRRLSEMLHRNSYYCLIQSTQQASTLSESSMRHYTVTSGTICPFLMAKFIIEGVSLFGVDHLPFLFILSSLPVLLLVILWNPLLWLQISAKCSICPFSPQAAESGFESPCHMLIHFLNYSLAQFRSSKSDLESGCRQICYDFSMALYFI